VIEGERRRTAEAVTQTVSVDAPSGLGEHRRTGSPGQLAVSTFRAVVATQHGRITAVDGEAVELGDEVVTGDETWSSRQTSATSLPSFNIRSAVASLRTTCSGVCCFLLAMAMRHERRSSTR
jgi:hypothetical protein